MIKRLNSTPTPGSTSKAQASEANPPIQRTHPALRNMGVGDDGVPPCHQESSHQKSSMETMDTKGAWGGFANANSPKSPGGGGNAIKGPQGKSIYAARPSRQGQNVSELFSPQLKLLTKGAPRKESTQFACPALEKPRLDRAKEWVSEIDVISADSLKTKKDVCSEAFELFEKTFPNPDEREDVGLIKERIEGMKYLAPDFGLNRDPRMTEEERKMEDKKIKNAKDRFGDSRFHVLVSKNHKDEVSGYFQFGQLPVGDKQSIVFGQYYAVDEKERKHGVMSTLYSSAWHVAKAESIQQKREFLGSIHESEMRGQGATPAEQEFTGERLRIHNRSGARVLMLQKPDGTLISPHIQPKLSADSNQIRLLFMFRPASFQEGEEKKPGKMPIDQAERLCDAYYDNFLREGFNRDDVEDARTAMKKQFNTAQGGKAVLLPADQVPDYASLAKNDPKLASQYQEDFEKDPAQLQRLETAKPAVPTP